MLSTPSASLFCPCLNDVRDHWVILEVLTLKFFDRYNAVCIIMKSVIFLLIAFLIGGVVGIRKKMSPSSHLFVDVGDWLAQETSSGTGIAYKCMFDNISPNGTAPGVVVASMSKSNPVFDYQMIDHQCRITFFTGLEMLH